MYNDFLCAPIVCVGWDELKLAALSSMQFVVDTAMVIVPYLQLLPG